MSKTLAVFVLFLATTTLYASTPSTGTLAAASTTVTWSGGPYTGATVDNSPINTSACTTLTCDSFNLSVNIPANFYTTYPNDEVQIGINWASDLNEFDLFIYDSGGISSPLQRSRLPLGRILMGASFPPAITRYGSSPLLW
jgi:hypothetical protein